MRSNGPQKQVTLTQHPPGTFFKNAVGNEHSVIGPRMGPVQVWGDDSTRTASWTEKSEPPERMRITEPW